MARPKSPSATRGRPSFDFDRYLQAAGAGRQLTELDTGDVVFAQGDPALDVRYLLKGGIKLSVLSSAGKEGVVAMLTPGDFFGEGVLAGQAIRISTATAIVASTVVVIDAAEMRRLLQEQPEFSDRFIRHMLGRNIRIEADLIDQLFNSSEKRLARALLLLAQYGQGSPPRDLPHISQETLAEMIGTTRSRVNFFMNKFRRLGLIEYNGGLKIHSALLGVVLHD
jgi:CRP-like cAMP-binding protein